MQIPVEELMPEERRQGSGEKHVEEEKGKSEEQGETKVDISNWGHLAQ